MAAHPNSSWPFTKLSRLDEVGPNAVRGKPGWEWVDERWPEYAKLTKLDVSRAAMGISAHGCLLLRPTLAAHAVLLYEVDFGR